MRSRLHSLFALLAVAVAFPARSCTASPPRLHERFDAGWRFHRDDAPGAENPGLP